MREARVALIGCGQLGSRHLQAVAKMKKKLKIQVVEPSDTAQNLAQKRLNEISFSKKDVQVEWLKNIDGLDKISDLTIVATTATERSKLINELLQFGHKFFLIEKMVCQSKKQYEGLLESFNRNKAKGWIDCTRRYFPPYNRLIRLLKEENPIVFNVTAGNLGLGCNAMHFLDLFSACIKDTIAIKLDGESLLPELLPNRRGKDLIEFAGTITARIRDNFASITSYPDNNAGIAVNIFSKERRIFLDEGKAKCFMATKADDWIWEDLDFKELFTSELTTRIAESIITDKTCELPTIEDLRSIHEELFRIFNQHIKSVTGRTVTLCPIT